MIRGVDLETILGVKPFVSVVQVLIRMKAIGINELELRIRATGWRWYKPPFTLGIDGAGVVDAVGEGVKTFVVSSRVFF